MIAGERQAAGREAQALAAKGQIALSRLDRLNGLGAPVETFAALTIKWQPLANSVEKLEGFQSFTFVDFEFDVRWAAADALQSLRKALKS